MQNNIIPEIKNEVKNEMKIENIQNNLIKNICEKTINLGIDIGIRAIFPDIIENEIISIKNNFIKYGIKEGIKKSIDEAIDIGKNILGIKNEEFKDINQIEDSLEKGELHKKIENTINGVMSKLNEKEVLNSEIVNKIRNGEKIITENIEKNINKEFEKEKNIKEKLDINIRNWEKSFENKNFDEMEKNYKEIKKLNKELIPFEKIINKIRNIENIETMIRNNGKNFNLTEEQLELAKKL